MPRYPTPTGTFVIARKVKNPSWTNPGGAWGRGMPRYIKPGPRNPLGTRALYLYRSGHDTGIRFHGTSNTGSIGHAASHGCMRMKRKDVEKFFTQVPVGTTVFVVK
jgi:lipoprotein-anchoring transpeptidase ErfK/SrfK